MVVDDDGKSYDTTRVSITSSVKYIYILYNIFIIIHVYFKPFFGKMFVCTL